MNFMFSPLPWYFKAIYYVVDKLVDAIGKFRGWLVIEVNESSQTNANIEESEEYQSTSLKQGGNQ